MNVRKTVALLSLAVFVAAPTTLKAADTDKKEDPATGMIVADHLNIVKANCMMCHSAKVFTQIRLDRENWVKVIRAMQEKNGLWPLGEMESKILDYLEQNYGLTEEYHNPKIRRPLLD